MSEANKRGNESGRKQVENRSGCNGRGAALQNFISRVPQQSSK